MTVQISGTSGYIADFSNATVASRQAFQTSTSNGTTGIYALPNGTSTAASWQATNNSNPTNASKILIATNGSTDVQLVSGINGTGTYLPLSFYTNGSQQMRLDTAGNLGLASNPSAWGSAFKAVQIGTSGAFVMGRTDGPLQIFMGANAYYDGSSWRYTIDGAANRYYQASGEHYFERAATGTAGNTVTWLTTLQIDSSGRQGVNVSPTNNYQMNIQCQSGVQGGINWQYSALIQAAALYCGGSPVGGGWGNGNSVFYVTKDSVTSRSISAAGTVNQNGADYAEYMTKAGDFNVAKGDVVGINAEGLLTNVFADAVSFCVKSTDPGIVGGDKWFTEPIPKREDGSYQEEGEEEFDSWLAALEAARKTVDRIAFCGQVPVNVTGATAGQYIIPVNENGAIKGEAVSNPTFEQYQQAVGKVIAIEQDGRARIIVKVA